MTENVLLVSTPDDVSVDGFRVLFVDLSAEQGNIITQALGEATLSNTVIAYTWKFGDSIEWLVDKKHKSQLIFFNAESLNQILVGYMTAQKNSYYFGTLRDLSGVNKSAVFDKEQCRLIFENYIGL